MPRFIKQFGQPRPEKAIPQNNLKDLLPLGSMLVAFIAVLAQMFASFQNQRLQIEQMKSQSKLKEYEISFKPKQESYTAFMKAFHEMCDSHSREEADINSGKLVYAFYGIEPFLTRRLRYRVMTETTQIRGKKFRNWPQAEPEYRYVREDKDRFECSDIQEGLHDELTIAFFYDNVSPDRNPD